MKNILLGFFVLAFSPQFSFGAIDPALTAFNQHQDEENAGFAQQLAQERGAWINAHQDIVNKLNDYGNAMEKYKRKKHAAELGHPTFGSSTLPTPVVDETYEAFKHQQWVEGQADREQLVKERQQFLASHPGIQ